MPDPSPQKRHDPPQSRVPDGAINDVTRWTIKVAGEVRPLSDDPDRVYCEANPNDPDCGVQEMRRLGWQLERARKDGPQLVGGDASSDGEILTRNGMHLMSRPRKAHQGYEAEKFRVADDRSRAIGQHGGADPIGGLHGLAYTKPGVDAHERIVRE